MHTNKNRIYFEKRPPTPLAIQNLIWVMIDRRVRCVGALFQSMCFNNLEFKVPESRFLSIYMAYSECIRGDDRTWRHVNMPCNTLRHPIAIN